MRQGFMTNVLTASITRPADSTDYTAGDVIGTAVTGVLEFAAAARMPGGSGGITNLVITSSANITTKPDLELWLFTSALAVVADNAAFAPTDVELLTLVGIIEIPVANWQVANAGSGTDGNVAQVVASINQLYKCAAGSQTLYGYLVARNAYDPLSGEVFTVKLCVTED